MGGTRCPYSYIYYMLYRISHIYVCICADEDAEHAAAKDAARGAGGACCDCAAEPAQPALGGALPLVSFTSAGDPNRAYSLL